MNKIIEEEKRYYKNNINCYNVFPDLDGSTISEKHFQKAFDPLQNT